MNYSYANQNGGFTKSNVQWEKHIKSLYPVSLHWYFKIYKIKNVHGGSIYTIKINKCYPSPKGFFFLYCLRIVVKHLQIHQCVHPVLYHLLVEMESHHLEGHLHLHMSRPKLMSPNKFVHPISIFQLRASPTVCSRTLELLTLPLFTPTPNQSPRPLHLHSKCVSYYFPFILSSCCF